MDIKDYELLIALDEHKNITKVSQVLFITQPALTKRIQKMEEELQCQLFLRSKKGVVLTPEGEAILPYARKIVSDNQMIHELTSSVRGEIGGTLQLGVSLEFTRYYLPDLLKRYTDMYPKVEVKITSGRSRDLIQLLKKGELSLAILRGEYTYDGEMEQLLTENMYLVCSEENQDRPLNDYPFIGRRTDGDHQAKIHKWMTMHQLNDLHPRFQIDDINTCRDLAARGLGWAILPEICLKDFHGYKKMVMLDEQTPFQRNTYVFYRKPMDELIQVNMFLKELRKLVAEQSMEK